MGSRIDHDGLEWDFLALDGDGAIAVISSAGYGQIPQRVLDNEESVEAAVESLRGLPPLGESIDLRPQLDGDYSEWFELSRRGVYTYDWHVHIGPYERVSVPTAILNAVDADPTVAKAAALLRLPFPFAHTARFSLDEKGSNHKRFNGSFPG